MLLKRATLDAIVAGDVTLAFRRWTRPTVKAGGRLRTVVGELRIEAVDAVPIGKITAGDARAAGFASRDSLVAELRRREGVVYRIRLAFGGADPRPALRRRGRMSKAGLVELLRTIERIDARARTGAWVREFLERIEASPATRAADLAATVGIATAPFKQRVRRLKELGLTESLEVGYRLAPRGRAALAALRAAE